MIAKMIKNYLLVILIYFLAACGHKEKEMILPGYIDGKYTYISTSFGGILRKLYVTAGSYVQSGQPLFALEIQPENENMIAAEARTQEGRDRIKRLTSEFELQKKEWLRNDYLFSKEVVSKKEWDISKTAYMQALTEMNAAIASQKALEADLEKAKWAVKQKIVTATFFSLVFDTYYNEGEFVPNGNPVLSLLAPSQVKIIFYVSEPFRNQLKLNQTIDVSCDGCRAGIKGKITYISNSPQFTPPIIYSSEERAKLVYRVEAAPLVENLLNQVHPGQPISIHLKMT